MRLLTTNKWSTVETEEKWREQGRPSPWRDMSLLTVKWVPACRRGRSWRSQRSGSWAQRAPELHQTHKPPSGRYCWWNRYQRRLQQPLRQMDTYILWMGFGRWLGWSVLLKGGRRPTTRSLGTRQCKRYPRLMCRGRGRRTPDARTWNHRPRFRNSWNPVAWSTVGPKSHDPCFHKK